MTYEPSMLCQVFCCLWAGICAGLVNTYMSNRPKARAIGVGVFLMELGTVLFVLLDYMWSLQ